jgi:hypothetical protein
LRGKRNDIGAERNREEVKRKVEARGVGRRCQ